MTEACDDDGALRAAMSAARQQSAQASITRRGIAVVDYTLPEGRDGSHAVRGYRCVLRRLRRCYTSLRRGAQGRLGEVVRRLEERRGAL